MTVAFLLPGTGSWTPPAGVTSVFAELIGGGGGGVNLGTAGVAPGGDGADYVSGTLSVTPGVAINCRPGSGGAAVTGAVTTRNPGQSSWIGGTSLGTASLVAKGGNSADTSVGTVINAGGTHSTNARGGGGAGGPNGAGLIGTDPAGGAGDNGFGGAGGAVRTAGSPGAEWTQTSDSSTAGSGGGGGGSGNTAPGAAGGLYGAGGGSNNVTGGTGAGNGAGGIIVLTYTVSGATTGSENVTLTLPTQTATGAVRVSGSQTKTLSPPTQTAAAGVKISASQSKTLALPTQTAAGKAKVSASQSKTLSPPTQTATGAAKISGSANQTLQRPTQTATVGVKVSGHQSATLALPTQTARATVTDRLFEGVTLLLPTQNAHGKVSVSGAANQLLLSPTQFSIGRVTHPTISTSGDRHVRRGGAEYASSWLDLLPRGSAWQRDPDHLLARVVAGEAEIWGDPVDARAADLLERESDPRATVELLPDWERAWGLPDDCVAEPLTIADRQHALVSKMTLLGGQSRAFFIKAAASIGYTITISEYSPFMCGVSRCGTTLDSMGDRYWQIGAPEMRFYWTVHVGLARLSWFRCSSGQCGVDPHLRIGLATDLECLLRRWKPGHTDIVFDYSGLATGGSMAGTP